MASLLPAVSLGHPPIEFMDASIAGYNNPTKVALFQAHSIWPIRDTIILSLGTGTQKIVDTMGGNLWQQLAQLSQKLIESCEHVHDNLIRSQHLLSYFHFSVDHGLEEVGVEEWRGWR